MDARRLLMSAGTLAFAMTGFGSPDVANAQQIVVQQPQRQVLEVGTVVSVPDRGSASLRGVRSASSGRNSAFGVPGNVGVGGSTSGASSSVHVTIHDFEAMDAALLHEAQKKQARAAATNPTGSAESVFARLHRPRISGATSQRVALKPRVRSSGP
jgi:hypothetical protein